MVKSSHTQLPFARITIIGVGLIGGSLALAVKHRFPSAVISGVDTKSVLRRAIQRRAIDIAEPSVARAISSADLIVLAVPVGTILRLLPVIAKHAKPGSVVTDTGSVKHAIVAKAERSALARNFIGGHPMTGAEFSGIEAAHPLLFQNAIYLLTPGPSAARENVKKLSRFFSDLDARVLVLDAGIHDKVVAAVSHLPQLAAVSLMNTVGGKQSGAGTHLSLAAGGFRDMTRIASSRFEMWGDILFENRKAILSVLRLYIRTLHSMEKSLRSKPSNIKKDFQTSRSLRMRIPVSMKGFLTPLVDLAVFVNDRPGQLALLTAVLAQAKINIKDMELLKVREGRGGTFRLSFENRAIALQAQAILRRAKFETSEL
jgi:prephenate dehydrogenase